jgi:hypothetical protein
MTDSRPCKIEQFTLWQKFSMRFCLYGFFAVGLAGVFLENIYWGIGYALFMALVPFVVLPCFCSHCPYPYHHETCLAMPSAIVRLFRQKPCKPSIVETLAFILVLTASLAIPQYFLWQRTPLFIAYWVLCLPTFIAFPFYFCLRCRFVNCPFHPEHCPVHPGRLFRRNGG